MKIALAGQPNAGKSTIFTMLSGIRQHVANYPGVTVDKKSGYFSYKDSSYELIDLPGTYSFSSYSLEERVAKKAIIEEDPDIIINVADASNLKRSFYLTFQLLEIGKPLILVLNMSDIARQRGINIDVEKLSSMLGCVVVLVSATKKEGKQELLDAIYDISNQNYTYKEFILNYEELEASIKKIEKLISKNYTVSSRWLAIKTLEKDSVVLDILCKDIENFEKIVDEEIEKVEDTYDIKSLEGFFASFRYDSSELVVSKSVENTKFGKATLTEKIDKFVLNRWLSFPILLLIIVAIYELAIGVGYDLTTYTWPIFAAIKNFVVDITPEANIAQTSLISDFALWIVNSINALLNYLPIFFILFAMIAILEDVGYMPRMAFILDRVFRKYGLHGQSTLPLVLGGAFAGGCAVPGIMSTKGIADERARMATIFTVPLMNCLSKVPFYALILEAFFIQHMGLMMFYISTITVFTALIISKIITSTILKTRETAPFVMELPAYHLPTIRGVFGRATERVWVYVKKVCTVVVCVAIILFVLLHFPGLNKDEKAKFDSAEMTALEKFDNKISKTKYYESFNERDEVAILLNFYDSYRDKKMSGMSGVDDKFMAKNELLYNIVKASDEDAKVINKALRNLSKDRNKILREQKNARIENSLLGMIGKSIEPLSKYAGFDWKINVAFLSSFAARESAVATVGSIYETGKTDKPGEMMRQGSGYTPLHAVAIIIFMLLSPPCIAAMVVVKLQANSWKFMLLALLIPIGVGLVLAVLVFSLGMMFNISGLMAMSIYYFITVLIAIILGLIPEKRVNWHGGLIKE